MTPKKYLMLVGILNRRIDIRQKQLEDMKLKMTATGGTDYSEDKVKGGLPHDTVADRVIDYIQMEDRLNRLIDQYIDIRDRITGQIEQMSDERYSTLLSLKYLDGMKLKDVAAKMNYDYKWTCQLHGRALQAFGERYQNALHKQDQTRLLM